MSERGEDGVFDEPDTEEHDVTIENDDTHVTLDESVKEENFVSVDTSPIPVPVDGEEGDEEEVQDNAVLYDERLHIKYALVHFSPIRWLISVLLAAVLATPFIIALFEQWFKLESEPVVGEFAKLIRITLASFFEVTSEMIGEAIATSGPAAYGFFLLLGVASIVVLAVVMIRPFYAWRISRVVVSTSQIKFLRPASKLLFLPDDSIIIEDLSIIRGVTKGVSVLDQWIFIGAGSILIDKDDQGSKRDEEPWSPVRNPTKLEAAIKTVIERRTA